jgi:hypothetical protein
MRLRVVSCLLLVAVWIGSADAGRDASVRRLRDMRSLQSAARRHPYTRKIIDRSLADQARTIDSVGAVEASRLAERLGWVPLGADPELRKVTVAVVMRKVRQRSRSLRKLIEEKPERAAWDVIFVGGGVHTAIAANTLANLDIDEPVRMLTIDGSNDLGGTFRELGSTVARNSANRASEKGKKITRGFGNKNESEGPWGDPDLDGQEYPELGILADTATVNLFASGTDFLLGSSVKKVEFRDEVAGSNRWPARFRVQLGDGTVVYANAVARSTGLGRPAFGLKDAASLKLISAERGKIDLANPDEVPGLLHYIDAMRLANASRRGRDPYRAPPPPRPRYTTLTGLRVRTSPPTTLRLGDDATVSLDQVIDASFDRKANRWTLRLITGRVWRAPRVIAEVANREIVLREGTSLSALADTIERLDVSTPIQVRRDPVNKKVPASRFTPEQRLAEIRRLARVDLRELRLRTPGRPSEPASRIADVYRDRDDGTLIVVRKDGTRLRIQGPLRLWQPSRQRYAVTVTADSPLFESSESKPRPVIAVIGGRDSGRTFLEYLYGQAPASAYNGGGKIDSAQRGEVGDVEWYVGERGPADCGDFLDSTRSRYLRLAGKVRDAGDGSTPRAALRRARIVKVTRLQSGRYSILDSRGDKRTVDKVIFATGFTNDVEEDGRVENLKGEVEGLEGERVIARKVRGRDLFRFGPAAGSDVVDADERYSTDENAGSLYAFGPRDRTFARTVLARTVRTVARLNTPALERQARVVLPKGTSGEASILPPRSARRLETPLSDLVVRAELLDVLSSLRGATTRDRLSFSIARGKGGKLEVRNLNHGRADLLAQRLAESPLLCDQLADATSGGQIVEVSVPLRRGVPQRARLTISM